MSQNGARFNGDKQGSAGIAAPIGGQPPNPRDIWARMKGRDVSLSVKHISRERPVLIAGPTASGKSALASEIAARDGRVVVNADALQVYAQWRVLTARPSRADEAAIPHALYGHVAHDQTYSVGHWLREVQNQLDRPVVIVGGTGLYFAALTKGLAAIPATPAGLRQLADARVRAEGHLALLAELDAATVARIDGANPVRVQRAWEVLHATGEGLAVWQDRTGPAILPLDACDAVVIMPDVAWLNARIDARFGAMIAAGALDEARAALPHWSADQPWARAIGAPELIAHLRGDIGLDTAVQAATLASRQYAKRQRTWFRSQMKDWRQINVP